MGIVMSNHTLNPDAHAYPSCFRYCIGLDGPSSRCDATAMRRLTGENLRRENCVGIKLYPGYNAVYTRTPVLTLSMSWPPNTISLWQSTPV